MAHKAVPPAAHLPRLQGAPRTLPMMLRAGCSLLVVALPALAQTIPALPSSNPRTAAEEGLRRQEDLTRQQQRQLAPQGGDTLQPGARVAVSTQLPEETPCFVLRDIRIAAPDGAPSDAPHDAPDTTSPAARFPWLATVTAPFLGQCAGTAGLRQIASAIDGAFIERGYATTRVLLPEQNLADGVLHLQLHVGRVSGVRIEEQQADGTPKPAAWGTWRNAFPVDVGEPLNVRDLEQGVEQMNRVPSQNVGTRIEPGTEPDTSEVVIVRRNGDLPQRVRGGLTVDNAGSSTLGRTQAAAYLSLDNPLGLNDIVTLSGNTNAERTRSDHRSQSAGMSYSLPFGYHTFTVSASRSRFAQNVQGTTVSFLSSGQSSNLDFRWHATVWRSASAKLGVFAGIGTRRARSWLDDVELLVQRRRTTNAELGVTYRQLFGDATLDMEAGIRKGVSWFNAQDDLPAQEGVPTLRPRIATLSAGYVQPFHIGKQPFRYSGTVRAQFTRDTTLSIDQMAIGSRYTVRGFDGDNVLLAENGYVIRNEWLMPVRIGALPDGFDSALYLGLDAGRVWGRSDVMLAGRWLAGAALGLRTGWRGWQADIAIAAPLYYPKGFRTRGWSPYLSLTYGF